MFLKAVVPHQPTSVRVLLVHQSTEVTTPLTATLEKAGMKVVAAHDGAGAIAVAASFAPTVALVSLDLADMNGADLIQWLGARDLGVVGLNDADEEMSRVIALELGADDCVSVSLHGRELVARIRALHRRIVWAGQQREVVETSSTIEVGPIMINLASRTVTTGDDTVIALTGAEFSALEVMTGLRGETISREALSRAALRKPWRAEDRSVDQLVFGLRQKLPLAADGSSLIHTVRGAGYVLRTPEPRRSRSVFEQAGLPAAMVNGLGAGASLVSAYQPLN